MKTPDSSAGFSLIEVTLALGVMAFCLLALFGLIPVGLSSNQTSFEQTAAGNIATGIAADLISTPLTASQSSRYKFNMAAASGTVSTIFFSEDSNPTGGVGAGASTGQPTSRYRASVAFYPGGAKKATSVRILVTWPALANPSATGWPTKLSGSFETVIALNRN